MTTDPEIPELVEKVQTFQKQEKDEKQLSFYAALSLNAGYFWNFIEEDPLLKARTVSDIAFFTLRLLLEDQEVLFPCSKSLLKTVERLEHKPEGVLDRCRAFLENPCEQTREALPAGTGVYLLPSAGGRQQSAHPVCGGQRTVVVQDPSADRRMVTDRLTPGGGLIVGFPDF